MLSSFSMSCAKTVARRTNFLEQDSSGYELPAEQMQDKTHGELTSGVADIAMAVTTSPKTAAAQVQARTAAKVRLAAFNAGNSFDQHERESLRCRSQSTCSVPGCTKRAPAASAAAVDMRTLHSQDV